MLESYLHQLQMLEWDKQGSANNYSAITAKRAIYRLGHTVSDGKYFYSAIAIIGGECYRTVRKTV